MDWGQFIAGLLIAAALLVAAAGLWLERGGVAFLVPLLGAAWFAWSSVRDARVRATTSEMTLTLAPDALRLASNVASSLSVELPRDRAGWLIADEVATDWHWRRLTLVDDGDRERAQFIGSLAAVRVAHAGVPHADVLPDHVPVAVLLGAWWPHPAKRMTRQGSKSVEFRWRDPDVTRFPAFERRSRILWSALYAVLAVLCLAAAFDGSSPWQRVAFGAAGVALLVWRVRELRWRPRFLGSA
jgi:hypothetical protein